MIVESHILQSWVEPDSDKIMIIERLLEKVDHLIIGGGMSYTFFKAMGDQIGNSLVEEDKLPLALELIQKAKSVGVDLMLPIDSVIADAFSNDTNTDISMNNTIPSGWISFGHRPQAAEYISSDIRFSKTNL